MLLTCSCNNDIFTEVRPGNIEEGDFRIWSVRDKIKLENTNIPLLKCIVCGRYYVPSTSFAGKNQLDNEIKFYRRLLEIVASINKKISLDEEDKLSRDSDLYHSIMSEVLKVLSDQGSNNEQVKQDGGESNSDDVRGLPVGDPIVKTNKKSTSRKHTS